MVSGDERLTCAILYYITHNAFGSDGIHSSPLEIRTLG